MIQVDISFEKYDNNDPDSDGEPCDKGMWAEGVVYSFSELVLSLKGGTIHTTRLDWTTDCTQYIVIHDQGETDTFFREGIREFRQYHFSPANPPKMRKYWKLALKAAGYL